MNERSLDDRIRQIETFSGDHSISFEETGRDSRKRCQDTSDGADIAEEAEVIDDCDWTCGWGEDAGHVDHDIEK